MLRLGLCCIFREAPIKFRNTTAKVVARLTPRERAVKLADLCRQNAEALRQAVTFCAENKIHCFRVNSQILPLKTHPEFTYQLTDLPDGDAIRDSFEAVGKQAAENKVRLTMHPDQFVVLNSPRESVVRGSIAELEYQGEFAQWTGVDVINIHGGGAYGDKQAALTRLIKNVPRLSRAVRERLTVENDDRTYTPEDLLPVCDACAIPLVYDVHHHRCNPDSWSIETATAKALETWGTRPPLFHISTPRDGWDGVNPRPHHDFIDPADIPDCWKELDMYVEVEAKAKELAVLQLTSDSAYFLSPDAFRNFPCSQFSTRRAK
ncbi:MAG: UV DNA damage repair endonuclease UvsE [Lentisphaeria bacterium]|nr:UV DNA damage repair endonuclease UvsE [Lentisphaeria bacterium]